MGTHPFEAMERVMVRRSTEIEDGVQSIVKRATRAWHETTVRNTPVDSGLHRSNWVVTVDQPFGAVIPPFAPGRRLGIDERANAEAAIAAAKAVIERFNVKRNKALVITNNAPVIVSLNAGTVSRQSSNFVELGLQAARSAVGKAPLLKER